MTKAKPKLKEIGTISHISSTKKLIVPSDKTPRIGSLLVNNKNQAIGKINDIFGSTKKPYISIKTNNKFKKAKPGEVVYLSPQNKNRRKKNGRNSKKKKTFR
jgi:RNA-binding protein